MCQYCPNICSLQRFLLVIRKLKVIFFFSNYSIRMKNAIKNKDSSYEQVEN